MYIEILTLFGKKKGFGTSGLMEIYLFGGESISN